MFKHKRLNKPAFLILTSHRISPAAFATSLASGPDYELNGDLEIAAGVFSSDKNYLNDTDRDGATWQEGYIKLGVSGDHAFDSEAGAYGALNVLSSGTWGDGDAGGFTSGNERRTDLEDAYIGFRSGNLIPALGTNGLDVSFGRQNFTIGDGFLINGDSLNLGDSLNGGGLDFDRGGAYWLAARKAFDQTAIARIGGDSGIRSDLFWLQSDNNAQADTELAGINLEYVAPYGTFGLLHIEGLDVNDRYDQALGLTNRDGQKTTSLRYQGNAGREQLFLSGEFVTQDQGESSRQDAEAWYVETGWSFEDTTWSPSVTARFSQFDEGFDPLFFGFNRGYGTWFQGEVAANYAGPFNTDTDVLHLGVKAYPTPALAVGALFFDFSDTNQGSGTLDSQEINVYAEWAVHEHLFVSPVIGFYQPENSASNGGSQLQDDDMNTYAQIIAVIGF